MTGNDKILKKNDKMIFGITVGLLYILFGITQFLIGFGISSDLTSAIFIHGDIIGGLILILIGVVFIFGFSELRRGTSDGVAYIYIGIMLGIIFLVIYLLIILANSIEAYLIMSDEFSTWSPIDDLNPGIYLGVLSLIGFIIWRSKFSLK